MKEKVESFLKEKFPHFFRFSGRSNIQRSRFFSQSGRYSSSTNRS